MQIERACVCGEILQSFPFRAMGVALNHSSLPHVNEDTGGSYRYIVCAEKMTLFM